MQNVKQIHLIEVAEELFAKNGYSNTSIRDIAKSAKVNSAMISYYFGSKENLMQAIVGYRTMDLKKLFEEFSVEHKNPTEEILALVEFFIDKVFEQRSFYRLIFQLQSLSKESVILEHFDSFRHRNFEMLKDVFDRGAKDGTFQKEIDVSLLTSMVSGTINHIVFNKENYRKVNHLEDLSEKDFILLLKQRIKDFLEKVVLATIK